MWQSTDALDHTLGTHICQENIAGLVFLLEVFVLLLFFFSSHRNLMPDQVQPDFLQQTQLVKPALCLCLVLLWQKFNRVPTPDHIKLVLCVHSHPVLMAVELREEQKQGEKKLSQCSALCLLFPTPSSPYSTARAHPSHLQRWCCSPQGACTRQWSPQQTCLWGPSLTEGQADRLLPRTLGRTHPWEQSWLSPAEERTRPWEWCLQL